jgi:endonuclease III
MRIMVTPQEINKIFSILERDHQPTMLEQFENYTPFQLLVMTLLSSRTKDSTTIPIVKKLFAKYPEPEDFIDLPVEVLEKESYGIGFYRVKARHVRRLSVILLDKFKGVVPDTREGMMSLPGVGRKTANCMLNYAFKKAAIAVDIHVHRICNRLGWISTIKPEESERELERVVPKELWIKVNELLVDYGQRVCLPIKPKCSGCKVIDYCEFGRKKKLSREN